MNKVNFQGEELTVELGHYITGGISIQLTDSDGMPYVTATKNLLSNDLKDDEVHIKNYFENDGILEALIIAGIIADTGRCTRSGFVILPICKVLVKEEG